jgi:drug/metabolite transporter (DMT)-like permease
MQRALALAILSSLCFGMALVTGRIGLRSIDARSGAAVSIPTATVLFALAAPFAFDGGGFTVLAALIFAAVGLFFPGLVTILTFRSNERLGPTMTGAVSCTAPLFALLAAGLLLGEKVPARAAVACVAIVVGIAVLSWKQDAVRPGFPGWSLLWPISGAVVRGLAQAGAKAGLVLWPSPFSASLLGYSVSSAIVIGTNQIGRSGRPRLTRHGVVWFALTGILNGGAVLLMYGALSVAPVSLVAPIVATYPLVTAAVGAVVLREETVTPRMAVGAAITVLAMVYLVASGTGA